VLGRSTACPRLATGCPSLPHTCVATAGASTVVRVAVAVQCATVAMNAGAPVGLTSVLGLLWARCRQPALQCCHRSLHCDSAPVTTRCTRRAQQPLARRQRAATLSRASLKTSSDQCSNYPRSRSRRQRETVTPTRRSTGLHQVQDAIHAQISRSHLALLPAMVRVRSVVLTPC